MNDSDRSPAADAHRDPELNLMLSCARWPQDAEDRELIRRQSAQVTDWEPLLHLAQHHRLVPLVARNLHASLGDEATPEQADALESLQQMSSANSLRALRSLAELRRVVQELESHDIKVRVLKGIPLAQSIFGDLGLRATGDLDLLVDEDSILEADRVLRGFGYRGLFQIERFTPKRLAFYRTHWKDLAYHHPATGFEVDLHWRCFRNRAMAGAALCDASPNETVSFGRFQVKTLPAMESLLYLCVHGTLDGWLYLKSLADVAAQVRAMNSGQLDQLASLASGYGVLPELSAALILVRRYFSMRDWSTLLLSANDATVKHILRFARRSLEQGGFLSTRDSIPASAMMAFEIGLRHNFRYRWELLLRVLFRARMWETIPLPDFLFGIYPLLSPFEWVLFRVRQRLAKPPSSISLSI